MDANPGETLFESLGPEQSADMLAVVARIVHPRSGASDWTLQKTYYLACVESIEDRLAPLPGPKFFSWNYGPWSRDLREMVEMAAAVGDVNVSLHRTRFQSVTKIYRWPARRALPILHNAEDETFLHGVLERIGHLPGEELTRLAKETAPYRSTGLGQMIDLDQYLIERRAAIERLSDDERLAEILSSRGH